MTHAPENEAALATLLRDAGAAQTPLEITGGGSRRGLGRPVQAAEELSTAALADVALYEPGELTLIAGAGLPLAKLDDLLEAENQQLTFEPPDLRALLGTRGTPTLGGAVATAASGPRRLRMGACRDALLGLRFVDGTGAVHRAGGRVMKNVTGYDLTRLMCGAHGTLGVITEIALKTMPRAEIVQTLALHGLDDAQAVAALSDALRTPTDVSAAAHLPAWAAKELGFADAVTLLRVEGFETQVKTRRAMLAEALAGFGALEEIHSSSSGSTRGSMSAQDPRIKSEGDGAIGDPWPAIRDAMMFAGDDRAVWRISVKPTDGPKLVAALATQMDVEAFYDWGGGLVWLAVHQEGDAGAGAIRAALAGFGGHATLIRASDAIRAAVPVFQPEPEPLAKLSAGLRAKFDPAGILNPGRMREA